MIMLLLGGLSFVGFLFLMLVFFALTTSSVLTFFGTFGFIAFVWWLSGRGGKPTHFWPDPGPGPEPRRWGPNHIGHPAGQNSLDHPDMW